MLRPLPIDNIFCLQIFRCLQNCQIYESKILLLYVRAWLMHRGLLRFFLSLDYSKNTTKEESQMSNFHTTLQKIVLYWCLGLIRHNIGTRLKLNKYVFDISIPLCHHLYLSATLNNASQNLQSAGLPSIMLTCQYEDEFLRAIWLVGYF
jgi:hypothetical protein